MNSLGKALVVVGLVTIVLGLLVMFAGKIPFLGRLPGDIKIEGKNYTFYMPLGSCLLVSAILSLIFWLISRFRS
jgi:hypothetical protein